MSQSPESPVLPSTPVDDEDFVKPGDKSIKKRINSKVSCIGILFFATVGIDSSFKHLVLLTKLSDPSAYAQLDLHIIEFKGTESPLLSSPSEAATDLKKRRSSKVNRFHFEISSSLSRAVAVLLIK